MNCNKLKSEGQKQRCQFCDINCWVEGGKFSEMGALYIITCKTCDQMVESTEKENPKIPGGANGPNYIGMTAGSLHARHEDHRKGHLARSKKNCLVKHEIKQHSGIPQSYSAKHISREKGLLHLALKEALMIEGQREGTSLNDRNEHGRSTGVIRISSGIT